MSLNLGQRKLANKDEVLYMGFNQDHGCFAVGMSDGFRIYNCDPFRETFRRRFPQGGIGIVEMLFRCNILALVGGGKTPCFPDKKVKLWDDHTMQVIGDITFTQSVKAVKLRRDTIVVATRDMVFLYSFEKLDMKHKFPTDANELGLFALSAATDRCVVACKGQNKGQVRVENINEDSGVVHRAHDSALGVMALNKDGTLLATTSEKGTLIRIYDPFQQDKLLKELRRGMHEALIYSLCFSHDSKFIACSSSRGTIHVFALGNLLESASGAAAPQNSRSMFSSMGGIPLVGSYLQSEWSCVSYNGLEGAAVCVFGSTSNDTLHVLCADGRFMKLHIDPVNGECTEKNTFRFPTE